VLAPATLIDLVNHFKGRKALTPPEPGPVAVRRSAADLIDVKGQEAARRALEVAAAGNHHILLLSTYYPAFREAARSDHGLPALTTDVSVRLDAHSRTKGCPNEA